ncbi:hypothetical protein BJV85_002886 [Clostridium acetobutylicum]|nr:hypothetical protein [Clostridium acetobutylicum]NOW15539.1 hypothetical protein [Clostridium acetobutylicum]NRY57219.1 hypothetical protein [Clostridium acetobutylicum]NSA93963.1 hypothetical protein [Clostridium acetobutylicum]NYC95097.1 hypothetical protein [Clostridium acetobutylicum]
MDNYIKINLVKAEPNISCSGNIPSYKIYEDNFKKWI